MDEKGFDYMNVIPLVDVDDGAPRDCPDDLDVYCKRRDSGRIAESRPRPGRAEIVIPIEYRFG